MTERSDSHPTSLCVDTGIGTLALFPQRFQDIGAFSKLPLDEPPPSRLRLYLPYMASLAGPTNGNGDRSRINEESAQQLSGEDLERVAEAYLGMPEMRQIAQGSNPSSNAIVRENGEYATAYLDRLLQAAHDQQMEDPKATYQTLEDKSARPISSALDDVDRQASSLREVAANFMQGHGLVDPQCPSDLVPDERATPSGGTGTSRDDARITANDLKHAHDEEIMLTRGIGIVTTQSAILVASLSEAATQFLRQFSETAQKSDKAAGASLRAVRTMVLIVGLASIIAASAAIMTFLEARENRQMTTQWQESIERSISEIAASQAAQLKSLDGQIRELSDRQRIPPPATASMSPAIEAPSEKAIDGQVQPSPKSSSAKRPSKRKVGR
jgi:hypothetical protein